MSDPPRLEIIKLPDLLGDEWRAERARVQDETRRRYRDLLIATLTDMASSRAGAILNALFVVTPVEGGESCECSCHPHLPDSDFHDHGFGCSCQWTAEQRRAWFDQWQADMDAFWESSEGRAEVTAGEKAEFELRAWLGENPDVLVTSHGGIAPEQWWGTVDGHSFYFRERHDHWRIELDLRPSGRFYRAWVDGDLDDDASYDWREVDEGDVIADGTVTIAGYGESPVERARFIAGTIRTHLARQGCRVHRDELDDLECLFGRSLNWCPACGVKLYGDRPETW